MSFQYVGCCVQLKGCDIIEMTDQATDINRETFMARVGRENYLMISDNLGYERHHKQGLTLSQDWHVSYHRSKYRGKRCYFMKHSAIEHVFVEGEVH